MGNKVESILKFENYIVRRVDFVINENFSERNNVQLVFDINSKVKTDKNKLSILLETKIFENAEKNDFPFEMSIDVIGDFKISGGDSNKFIPNAIAILYPYVRAVVSTYTAQANVNPLILPPINVNKLIEENNK